MTIFHIIDLEKMNQMSISEQKNAISIGQELINKRFMRG